MASYTLEIVKQCATYSSLVDALNLIIKALFCGCILFIYINASLPSITVLCSSGCLVYIVGNVNILYIIARPASWADAEAQQ